MSQFNPIHTPKIYAYSDSRFPNCLKIGYTTQDNVLDRIRQQYPIKTPNQTWQLIGQWDAIKTDGTLFTDRAIHKELKKMGIKRIAGE